MLRPVYQITFSGHRLENVASRSKADLDTTVRHTEETLLGELIEWLAAQRNGLGH